MIFCIDPHQNSVTVFPEPGVQVKDILTAIALANLSCYSPQGTPFERILNHEAEMSRYIQPDNLRLSMLTYYGILCPLNVEVTSVASCVHLKMTVFTTDLTELLQRAAVFIDGIEDRNTRLRQVTGKLPFGTN